MQEQLPLAPGSHFGRYEILGRLASGGMADVWLAQSSGAAGFQKKLVLKTMLPHLATAPKFVRMFVEEARLAARLNHPNVVHIFDLGELDGRYFIAMEYVPGRTLRQITSRLRKLAKGMPVWFLLRTLERVCEGLQYAHDCVDSEGKPLGLVHRDISPENIMISFTGTVKLVDFGVARAGFTEQTKSLLGKYSYMPPELLHAKPVDRRGDIYAVGVILYEYLTGKRPFSAPNEYAVLAQIAEGRVRDPREIAPELPEELARITLKAMAFHPENRYQEAEELGDALRDYLNANLSAKVNANLGTKLSTWFSDSSEIPGNLKKKMPPPLPHEPAPPTDAEPSFVIEADVPADVAAAAPPPARVPDKEATDKHEKNGHEKNGHEKNGARVNGHAKNGHAEKHETPPSYSVFELPSRANGVELKTDIFSIGRPSLRSTTDIFTVHTRTSALRPARHESWGSASEPKPRASESPKTWKQSPAAECFDRGLELVRERQFARALDEWKRAVELEPENRSYKTNLKRLEKLLESEVHASAY